MKGSGTCTSRQSVSLTYSIRVCSECGMQELSHSYQKNCTYCPHGTKMIEIEVAPTEKIELSENTQEALKIYEDNKKYFKVGMFPNQSLGVLKKLASVYLYHPFAKDEAKRALFIFFQTNINQAIKEHLDAEPGAEIGYYEKEEIMPNLRSVSISAILNGFHNYNPDKIEVHQEKILNSIPKYIKDEIYNIKQGESF